jgi:hypothetical protein
MRVPGRKAIPWLLVLEAAMVARDHWGRLEPQDRRELARIVRQSKGLPQNLTARDRRELMRLVRALDPLTAGRRLMPMRGGLRGTAKRGR